MLTKEKLEEMGYGYVRVDERAGTWTAIQRQIGNVRIVKGRLCEYEGFDQWWDYRDFVTCLTAYTDWIVSGYSESGQHPEPRCWLRASPLVLGACEFRRRQFGDARLEYLGDKKPDWIDALKTQEQANAYFAERVAIDEF